MAAMAKEREQTAFERYGWDIPDAVIWRTVQGGWVRRTAHTLLRKVLPAFSSDERLSVQQDMFGRRRFVLSALDPDDMVGNLIRGAFLSPARYVVMTPQAYEEKTAGAMRGLGEGESLASQHKQEVDASLQRGRAILASK